jgi:beta-glucosidase
VTNTGKRAGDEVVQLYTHQRISRDEQPNKQLRSFERVGLQPGETKTVRLSVPDLRHWDVTRGKWVVESSVHDVMVGASASDIRLRSVLPVRGEQIPPRDLARDTRAIDFDDYSGVELVDESKVRGDAVGVGKGDWLRFKDVDFRSGVKTFTAKTARAEAGSSTVEIRLGHPRGRLVGTAEIKSTGDKYTYTTTSATVSGLSGRQDVYLVFSSDARISTFSLR